MISLHKVVSVEKNLEIEAPHSVHCESLLIENHYSIYTETKMQYRKNQTFCLFYILSSLSDPNPIVFKNYYLMN